MKTFKNFLTEEDKKSYQNETDILTDLYKKYSEEYTKDQIECVGWLDGPKNALTRSEMIYKVGIKESDSILDVGCGVCHTHLFLTNKGWKGKYLGIDPNQESINMVDENINAVCGTIDDLDNTKYDWAIASGIFNLGIKENHTFWIIENMIDRVNKGIVFNMLIYPYYDQKLAEGVYYEAYNPLDVTKKLENIGKHKEIKVFDGYMPDDAEFTVYYYV